MAKARNAISPTREENYPDWYQQVIKAADMAENTPVRGCMVIKPWGYGIWENIRDILDLKFKETGHKNAYFPLFIPKSFLQREAEHIDGFAKECAVVTHSRLEADEKGILQPAGELDEPLIVRPTSETIIGELFARWVQSYRDLPLLINQWANVVRWEMRPRLFLRTAEFLWQEGHTVHATAEEAMDETNLMLSTYAEFAENFLAMPVLRGEKTESERFPGADSTLCIEAMMQDRKALQAGTSHFLGQNFSKACGIKFQGIEGKEQYGWTTSWGVSTRLIGGMIMTHADDDGLVVPPRVAPTHAVVLPVTPKEETRDKVLESCHELVRDLSEQSFAGSMVRVDLDDRDLRGGEKYWQWVKKGIPLTVEIGPRDLESGTVYMGRRDQGSKRVSISRENLVGQIPQILEQIQKTLFERALAFRNKHTQKIEDRDNLYAFFTSENKDESSIHGGFALVHWDRDPKWEEQLKNDLKVTIRCIPEDSDESGICIFSGNPSPGRVVLAKSY
ncbi:MAG: proline--tRNA ligase [Opitutae bacterium]|nr:proline--tRNA ligase [Opitutae bacterium]|tara:strand:+ start:2115 stop:3629 length:1515 start_codon:yes stop_codon:yes gene_type:complete